MSTIKTKNVQVGTDGTASNNFTIYVPGTPDGTVRIGNGDAGAVTDAVTINSSGNVAFDTDTLYVDATNNRVGIGTSSPTNNLQIYNNGATSGQIHITNTSTGATASDGVLFGYDGSNDVIINNQEATATKFYTNAAERMRIDSSGVVRINNTANATFNAQLNIFSPNTINCAIHLRTNTGGTQSQIIFGNSNNDAVGSISTSGTSTAYNTSSDYRLKENVAPMSGSIDRLKQLKPSTWTWIHGGNGEGFIAHEAQEVVPESVTGTKDAMRTEEYEVTPAVTDDEGNVTTAAVMGTREVPDYQGIDQSKLVPLLTAALQEAITKIEDLETRIQALENPNGN